jgi:hypothetical protein
MSEILFLTNTVTIDKSGGWSLLLEMQALHFHRENQLLTTWLKRQNN